MEALRHNHFVHTILFSNNLLGPGCGKELAHCLRRNHVLKTCDVSFNAMGPLRYWKDRETLESIEGAGYDLGMAIRANKSLTSMNLEGNKLGGNTGEAFAQMLRKNQTLLVLNLASNEILVEGGRLMANSM